MSWTGHPIPGQVLDPEPQPLPSPPRVLPRDRTELTWNEWHERGVTALPLHQPVDKTARTASVENQCSISAAPVHSQCTSAAPAPHQCHAGQQGKGQSPPAHAAPLQQQPEPCGPILTPQTAHSLPSKRSHRCSTPQAPAPQHSSVGPCMRIMQLPKGTTAQVSAPGKVMQPPWVSQGPPAPLTTSSR